MTKREWNFFNPVKVQAMSLFDFLNSIHSQDEQRILLVTTPGFTHRGLTAKIKNALSLSEDQIFDQVKPNPDLEEIDQAISDLREFNFSTIIAVGGGSVIDTAKAFAAGFSQTRTLKSILVDGESEPVGQRPQLIAIPTTSGTGSEVTPFATIWHHQSGQKYSLTGPQIFCDQAILDPELTFSLPENETVFTALDAISHALESIWNKSANPVSQMFAQQALELAISALPRVLAQHDNYEARQLMQLSSLYAGYAISCTKTAVAHAISYPLTSRLKIPHGLACGLSLLAVMRHYSEIERLAPTTNMLFIKTEGLVRSLRVADHVRKYAEPDQILELAPHMFDPSRIGNFAIEVDEALLQSILRQSLELS